MKEAELGREIGGGGAQRLRLQRRELLGSAKPVLPIAAIADLSILANALILLPKRSRQGSRRSGDLCAVPFQQVSLH
jgi:hypothetical protein